MGRFDMTSRYDGTLRLTKSELYNELLDEAGPDAADSGMDYDLVKSKFRNSDGNGLEQKLEQIGFDIWEIAGDNPQEKFRALQLLKLLYSIEKDAGPGKKPVYISKALAKPSLDYFQEYLEFHNKGVQYVFLDIPDEVLLQQQERAAAMINQEAHLMGLETPKEIIEDIVLREKYKKKLQEELRISKRKAERLYRYVKRCIMKK